MNLMECCLKHLKAQLTALNMNCFTAQGEVVDVLNGEQFDIKHAAYNSVTENNIWVVKQSVEHGLSGYEKRCCDCYQPHMQRLLTNH